MDTDIKPVARKRFARNDTLGRALNAWDAQPRRVRMALVALYCLAMVAMVVAIMASWAVIHTFWPGQPAGQ